LHLCGLKVSNFVLATRKAKEYAGAVLSLYNTLNIKKSRKEVITPKKNLGPIRPYPVEKKYKGGKTTTFGRF